MSRPYLGATIDRQLDDVTKAFINDPARTRLDDGALYLNKVFDWHGEEFGDKIAFIRKYAEGSLKERLEDKAGALEIGYLKYDCIYSERLNRRSTMAAGGLFFKHDLMFDQAQAFQLAAHGLLVRRKY